MAMILLKLIFTWSICVKYSAIYLHESRPENDPHYIFLLFIHILIWIQQRLHIFDTSYTLPNNFSSLTEYFPFTTDN